MSIRLYMPGPGDRLHYVESDPLTHRSWWSPGGSWTGPRVLHGFAEALLEEAPRAFGRNAIRHAITIAHGPIETYQVAGTRKVIDISANTANNWPGNRRLTILTFQQRPI